MTTNQILLMQNRIAELEAENARLQKDYSDLQIILEIKERPTREQIAALVKPLEWDERYGVWVACGASYEYSYGNDKPRLFLIFRSENQSRNQLYSDFAELRAAAEQHHRETVLSFLNLPA